MYGIPCLAVDKTTGIPLDPPVVVVGYIGQSRQTVKQREEQHRDGRFGDLIVGGSFTIEEGWWTQKELDEKEQWYIESGVPLMAGQRPQRPVYNYDHNLGNPDRIEVWRAVEHRQRRQPGWTPTEGRAPHQRQPRRDTQTAARRRPRSVRWTRRRVTAALWAALWTTVAVPSGIGVAVSTSASATDGVWIGAGVATVIVGLMLADTRKSRRRRRKRGRR